MSEGEGETGGWRTLGRIALIITIVGGVLGIVGFFLSEYRESSRRDNQTASTAPQTFAPLEEAFIVSPVSWGRDLTVITKKARTGYKGNIIVFSCDPASGHYRWIGETDFNGASDEYVMGGEFDGDKIIIGVNVTPEDGDPKTVISSWDLKSLRRLAAPVARPGALQCSDFAKEF
jgi:hypothetical protein